MKKKRSKINLKSSAAVSAGFTPLEVLKETSITEKVNQKPSTGFTLIEILIYLVLFAILMSGAVAAAYTLFEATDRNQTKVMVQEEGDFMIAKINWALSGVQSVNAPLIGTSGSILSVNKWDAAVGGLIIALAGTDMEISHNGHPALRLNNPDIAIKNLVFVHNFGGGVNPESVQASFEINTLTPNGMTVIQDFSTTKFLRK